MVLSTAGRSETTETKTLATDARKVAATTDAQPIPVMLLVSGLVRGGAERQVVELARRLDRRRFEPLVCSLTEDVPLAEGLPDPLRDLVIVAKRWRFDASTVWRTARVMRERGIRLVHSFLFDAEIVGRLAGRLAGVDCVVGSERNSNYQRPWLQRTCLQLTHRLCDAVIANSMAGKRFVEEAEGFRKDRVFVVYNGVDIERFKPVNCAAARRKLGLPESGPVVGMVASFKPQKNHMMFLRMAEAVLTEMPNCRFLLVGGKLVEGHSALKPGAGFHGNVGEYQRSVSAMMEKLQLADRCLMPGEMHDLNPVYNACDVTVLTSRHEGTPNVLLESMACEAPVVATDVSDNARVVEDGEMGYVVALDDWDAMASRVLQLLRSGAERSRMGRNGRRQVEERFSPVALARNTERVYSALLGMASAET